MTALRSGLAACAAAVLAAACVSVPRQEAAPMPWPERRAALQADDTFALNGRVALSAPGAGVNASLRWQQEGDVSRLSLDGPLGVGGAEVELHGDRLDLRTSRGEHLTGDAARAELERRIGFPLPLQALRYWVRGVPQPGVAADEVLDEAHQRLKRLVQDGWEIDYAAWLESAAGSLPRRLAVRRDDTRVRLVVDHWSP
ncbi:MAG TPA: lipoprotein insertase outer membrane protein LolB [Steroidobacteraceae bacterium]|nr:lipoprotein insertase outer membrane protein LolB [Steroidobacteraceae bacterium]HQX47683.1 lipoprotein insertase outer membrane protein LolB [Steroidobacteraceae bacterium]HQX78009.1 lipoprotein insertase outer membrane protein LolB [Steroidobacteraceae bacterium]